MKTIVPFFISCILLQSCYSYKSFNEEPNDVIVGELYKFDLNNGKEFNVKIDSLGSNSLIVKRKNKQLLIQYSEIKTIETAEKSPSKTIGLISIIFAGAAFVTGIVYAFLSIDPDF